MAQKGARVRITLACTECKQRNYNLKKNKQKHPDRMELQKYCRYSAKNTPCTERPSKVGRQYGKENAG